MANKCKTPQYRIKVGDMYVVGFSIPTMAVTLSANVQNSMAMDAELAKEFAWVFSIETKLLTNLVIVPLS